MGALPWTAILFLPSSHPYPLRMRTTRRKMMIAARRKVTKCVGLGAVSRTMLMRWVSQRFD